MMCIVYRIAVNYFSINFSEMSYSELRSKECPFASLKNYLLTYLISYFDYHNVDGLN